MDENIKELAKLIYANAVTTNKKFSHQEQRNLALSSFEAAKVFYEVYNEWYQ